MRRWLLLVAVVLSGCSGPIRCAKVPIVIERHPTKPKPAGLVTVGCDGRLVLQVQADEVVR